MRKITDKKELVKLCSFIIMGDGGVYKRNDCTNYQFIMNMKKENSDYVNYCKDILENITSCRVFDRVMNNNDGYNRKEQLRLESNVHPFLTKLHDRIYTGTYKGIDPHALKLIDWECLAILFMSDGCGCIKKGYPDVTLNMKRLSYGDQLLLKKVFKDKFDLEWNINRQNNYYYLRLRTKDLNKFITGIKQYILPSFLYKILNVEPFAKNDDDSKGGEIV